MPPQYLVAADRRSSTRPDGPAVAKTAPILVEETVKSITSVLAALVLALALAGCGGDDETSSTTATTTETQTTTTETETQTQTETTETEQPTVVRIRVRGGLPAGGIARPKVDKGDRVVFVVTSDVSDEVHVHGYDLSRNVAPGKRARIAFGATIPGRFEVELEDRRVPIAELTVRP